LVRQLVQRWKAKGVNANGQFDKAVGPDRERSASERWPNNRLPRASPPINTANTTVCAWIVLPNIWARNFDQTTS
jgi:hypothetical protein